MFDSKSGEIRRWGEALVHRSAAAPKCKESDIHPITLTPYSPKMDWA